MKRKITGFHLDRFQEWVADLECGHALEMRHNPPYMECKWVGTGKGRLEHVGDMQECVYCDMPVLPDNAVLIKTSSCYYADTIPDSFASGYQPGGDEWVNVVVKEGLLQFVIHHTPATGFVLDPALNGVMVPGVVHQLRPAMGAVTFFLEYYRVD
jgi:tellurite resistance-related uncharacterized protein